MNVRLAGHIAKVGFQNEEYKYPCSEEIIPFGAGIMRGTDKENQCKLMTTGGQFLGVALFEQKNVYDKHEYAAKKSIKTLTHGNVWVQVTTAVVAGDVAACGAGGKFAVSGTSTYDDINGVFETSAEANGYAILKLK
ncbi:MAG: structural cement protein Gp24 [Sarcina sp.]